MTLRQAGLVAVVITLGVPAALAANATHPYANIDPRVDAGNDTGDSQVERLNQAQLGQFGAAQRPGYPPYARGGRPWVGAPGYARAYPPAARYGAPPPGYYPPPPGTYPQ